MTRNTNCNYIEPVFFGIAEKMMILLRRHFETNQAGINFGRGLSARPNSTGYSVMGFGLFGVFAIVMFVGFLMAQFAFFTLPVFFVVGLTFLALIGFFPAFFTLTLESVFSGSVLVKLRERFGFPAFGAPFRHR